MNTKNDRKSIVKWLGLTCLCGLSLLAAKGGCKLYSTVKNYQAIADKLPDLPAIHAPSPVMIPFPEKVWMHRVNSIKRAKILANKHKGLEIDVLYDSIHNYFDVGHPPTPSIGLSLDALLASIPNVAAHYFWLDYKNLGRINKVASCSLLVSIAKKYGLMNHLIVESNKPEDLSCFTDCGFYTSYYIPSFDLATCSKNDIQAHYYTIKNHLMNSRVNALSAPSRSLPFIEKYFPCKDILLWHLDDRKGLEYYASVSYLLSKKKVKILLINEESAGWR